MPTAQRIQTTYHVRLVDEVTGEIVHEANVNLSFPLDIEPDEVGKLARKAEAAARLRRLAKRGKVDIPVAAFAELDWNVEPCRSRLVTIETDDNGKPVRRNR